jgi:hypothetical protein
VILFRRLRPRNGQLIIGERPIRIRRSPAGYLRCRSKDSTSPQPNPWNGEEVKRTRPSPASGPCQFPLAVYAVKVQTLKNVVCTVLNTIET